MTTPKTRKQAKKNRPRRWIEKLFLLAGVAALAVWACSIGITKLSQDWENWVFDREMQGKQAFVGEYLQERAEQMSERASTWLGFPATPKPAVSAPLPIPPARLPTNIESNGLVGRLTIPRLHLSATVREGAEEDTLRSALGHIPHTAMPGQAGNVGVTGHRDTLFRDLREIRKHDLIVFETLSGRYVYETGSFEIVSPRKVSVLHARQYPELTLVTCYPFSYVGPAPQRFIVKARQVSHGSAEPDTVSEAVREPPEPTLPANASEVPHNGVVRRVRFEVSKSRSRQLAHGISLGLTGTDVNSRRVNGWIWLMPDRRTIWLRGQPLQKPVTFYGRQDGRKRELVITSLTQNSASGYLLLPEAKDSNSE